MITPDRARELAYLWHSGQSSPLYAFASSGLVKDPVALGREIVACQHDAKGKDLKQLQQLDAFIAEHVIPTRPGASWPHHFAPWARKEYL